MDLACIIPCYNEAEVIEATIESVLANTRVPDQIIVVPNGCTDNTADLARQFVDRGVVVMELPRLPHTKSQALNLAWNKYCVDADLLVCLDADTQLPPEAFAEWIREFEEDTPNPKARKKERRKPLGASALKFTLVGDGILARMQRMDFALSIDIGLDRGTTSVCAGAGSAFRNDLLRHIAAGDDREGPWSYHSQVEDFEVTYQIRRLGYRAHLSQNVRGYTDNMKTFRALWGQRMKWQVGTLEDLWNIGVNRLTLRDWMDQASGLFNCFVRYLFVGLIAYQLLFGVMHFMWQWFVIVPVFTVIIGLNIASRIPNRDWKDYALALALIPYELFGWFRVCVVTKAWWDVLVVKTTGRRKDRWAMQEKAEGGSPVSA